jgi:hypothetical protein
MRTKIAQKPWGGMARSEGKVGHTIRSAEEVELRAKLGKLKKIGLLFDKICKGDKDSMKKFVEMINTGKKDILIPAMYRDVCEAILALHPERKVGVRYKYRRGK